MRPYRAKRKDNGEWVYGWYVVDSLITETCNEIHYIIPFSTRLEIYRPLTWISVYPETVGQQVGRQDKHKKEIYDGDKMESGNGLLVVVKWDIEELRWITESEDRIESLAVWNMACFEIIGTIHDAEAEDGN